MNERKFALGIGLAGIAFIALLAYLGAPDLLPSPAVALRPAGGSAVSPADRAVAATPVATAAKAAADCSAERLNSWRLMSVAAGGYRQGGFAVLNNALRGTVTVTETQVFDGDLQLEKITGNTAELRCGEIRQTRVLADSRGADPEMRTALPDPGAGN